MEKKIRLAHRDDSVLCEVGQTSDGWYCKVSQRASYLDDVAAEKAFGFGETAEEAIKSFRARAAHKAREYMAGH